MTVVDSCPTSSQLTPPISHPIKVLPPKGWPPDTSASPLRVANSCPRKVPSRPVLARVCVNRPARDRCRFVAQLVLPEAPQRPQPEALAPAGILPDTSARPPESPISCPRKRPYRPVLARASFKRPARDSPGPTPSLVTVPPRHAAHEPPAAAEWTATSSPPRQRSAAPGPAKAHSMGAARRVRDQPPLGLAGDAQPVAACPPLRGTVPHRVGAVASPALLGAGLDTTTSRSSGVRSLPLLGDTTGGSCSNDGAEPQLASSHERAMKAKTQPPAPDHSAVNPRRSIARSGSLNRRPLVPSYTGADVPRSGPPRAPLPPTEWQVSQRFAAKRSRPRRGRSGSKYTGSDRDPALPACR